MVKLPISPAWVILVWNIQAHIMGVLMGASYISVTDNAASYTLDNTTFDVQSGAGMTLYGSSDLVFLESGAGIPFGTQGYIRIVGTGNTVLGSSANGAEIVVSGSDNVISAGSNSVIIDGDGGGGHTISGNGHNDTITVGVNSNVTAGVNSKINMTSGYAFVATNASASVSGSSDSIEAHGAVSVAGSNNNIYDRGIGVGAVTISGTSNTVSVGSNRLVDDSQGRGNLITIGDGNQIVLGSGGTLNINGSNNSVSFNTANGAETIQAAGGYFVKEDASGNISMNASSFTVQNGVALIGLGNGNVVTVSNMKSGLGADLTTNSQANQLVSAMASYSGSAAGVTSTVAAQAPVEASLFASAHQ
ncbi:hypothetical protein [Paraburkholderia sacchari]|uniref:hypothetical protein n=1 Tax=Paraburkholderia sacchari TaxID=159450 RepID=UPI003D9598CE